MDNITFVSTFRMESYCHIDTSDVNKVIDITIAIITRVEVFISSYFFELESFTTIYLSLSSSASKVTFHHILFPWV
jgi:hypothetical protein